MALREAAVRLMTEHGYDATSTDDIARAANVSPRTFFNYFPTKESVILLPEGFLSSLVEQSLRSRPASEDPVASVAAAAVQTLGVVETWAAPRRPMVLMALSLMMNERRLRQIMLDRRAELETVAWRVLQERGASAHDLALRAAVAVVVSLTYLALQHWADEGGQGALTAVLARCLIGAPEPARLAQGALAAGAPSGS
jgi:AcrR family transcriptional regulator